MYRKWILFFIVGIVFFACQAKRPAEVITIATAANMQFAMEALSEAFTLQTGISCQLVVSSSGKLTAQIKEGAPFDLFVAANMKYPQAIQESGLALEPPVIYAYGKLVLWTLRKDLVPDLNMLATSAIRQIAIANPKTAPYGQAALESLEHKALAASVKPKLVYGESIAQANQFILTQAADVGFTAMSIVLSPKMKNQGQWVAVDEESYTPIAQGVVLLKNTAPKVELARQFYLFLSTAKAKEILEDFGYQTAVQ